MSEPTYMDRMRERSAARSVVRFYKRWQKRQWKAKDASNALQHLERELIFWVGEERAKELMP